MFNQQTTLILIIILLFIITIIGFGKFNFDNISNISKINKKPIDVIRVDYSKLDNNIKRLEERIKNCRKIIEEQLAFLPQHIIDSIYETENLEKLNINKPKKTNPKYDKIEKQKILIKIANTKYDLINTQKWLNKKKLDKFMQYFWIAEILLFSLIGIALGVFISIKEKQRLVKVLIIFTIIILLLPYIVSRYYDSDTKSYLLIIYGLQAALLIYLIKYYKKNSDTVNKQNL